MQTASPTPHSPERREEGPTLGDMLWEVSDLLGGAVVTFLPLLIFALPSLVLLLPVAALLAVAAVPVVVVGAILAPAYLLIRSVLRRGLRREGSMKRSAPAAVPSVAGATR